MRFEIAPRDGAWVVTDGSSIFGIYPNLAKAESSARNLNSEPSWGALTPAETVDLGAKEMQMSITAQELTGETVMRTADPVLTRWSARVRSHEPRKVIARGGGEPKVHLIRRGWAARCRMMPDGRRQIVELLVDGDHCGLELSPFQHRASDLVALTACEVASIPVKEVTEALEDDPALLAALSKRARLRNAMAEELLTSLGRRTALERTAHLFCELLLRKGGPEATSCDMPLPQVELSDVLGLSIVHLNRTMQVLRRLNLANVNHRRLTTPDLAGLRGLAGFDPDYLTGL